MLSRHNIRDVDISDWMEALAHTVIGKRPKCSDLVS